jgi:hypothetical protein
MAEISQVTVRIRNWTSYKGRKDVEHNSWFRCSNRLLEDPDFFDFSAEEILVWIYILSISSQKNSDTVTIKFSHADRVCRLKPAVILSALEKLYGNQLDPVDVTPPERGRDADVTEPNAAVTETCATDRQTNITNKTERERAREEIFEPKSVDELRSAFDDDARKAWRELYPDPEFRKAESLKCFEHWRNDPSRPTTVDGWKQKLGSWFSLGWPSHLKATSRNARDRPAPTVIRHASVEKVLAEQAAARAQLEAEAEPVEIDPETVHPAVRGALKAVTGGGR